MKLYFTATAIAIALSGCKSSTNGDDYPIANRGQKNLGNTCYFNAIIQAMIHTDVMLGYSLDGMLVDDKKPTCPIKTSFKSLITQHWDFSEGGKVINPSKFLKICRENVNFSFTPMVQEDANEAFTAMVDMLKGADSKFTFFDFQMETVAACKNPDREYVSQGVQNSVFLTLQDTTETVDLGRMIHAELVAKESEIVAGKCGSDTDPEDPTATRTPRLKSLPQLLSVLIGRVPQAGVKLKTPIAFPQYLPLDDSVMDHIDDPDRYPNGPKYKLAGVVHHHGSSPNQGHYTAEYYNDYYGEWFAADDSKITRLENGPTTPSNTVYLLIYRLL